MNEITEFTKEIIKRILFPRPNRAIARAVVYSGLGILSKSFLVWVIEIFVKVQFETNVTGNDEWIGLSLVLIGLLFFLMSEKSNKENGSTNKPLIKEHDVEVLTQFEKLLDEDFVFRFTEEVGGSARCYFRDQSKVEYFLEEVVKSKYFFNHKTLEERRIVFVDAVRLVADFLLKNFDTLDIPDLEYTKMCKQSDNPYGNRPEYEKLSDGELWLLLVKRLNTMKEAFFELRLEAKKLLFV